MPDFSLKKFAGLHRLSDFWFNALVAAVAIFAGIIWSAISGKDLNWDQLNYHFYLGYSLFEDRIAQDFVAANGQSYLNPLIYAPFYWMVTNGWNSLLVASLLSILQSLSAVVSYFIARAIVPGNAPYARLLAVMAAVLTFLSPVLLMEIGTTFADASTATLVLAAALCGLYSNREASWWRDWSIVAGLLMGVAAALKLSNAVFGPPCALLIVLMQPTWSRRVRALFLLGLGFAIGLVLFNGYWGWQLWKGFGNPFFPNFGNFFPTDIFPKEGAPLERFLPDSILDVLLVPFRMVLLRTWIYIENVAPDLRFAALVLIVVFGAAYVARTKRLSNLKLAWSNSRSFIALSAYFLLAFALWQWTSGNGRYGLAVSLLCGPMLVLTTYVICKNARVAVYLLAAIIVLQVFHLQNGDLRWSKGAWTSTWYDLSIPERLRTEPYLYISVGKNSNSYVFPFLARESAFTNPIGQTAFELQGYGGPQLQQLFAKYRGRIRVIAMAPTMDDEAKAFAIWAPGVDGLIARLGYAIDRDDCATITSADGSTPIGAKPMKTSELSRRIFTCRLLERPYLRGHERDRITKIAKEVVEWCPKLFKPAYSAVEQTEHGWTVNYPSTDSTLMVSDNQLLAEFFHSSATFSFGSLEEWEKGIRPSCASFPDKPRNVYNFY